MGEAIFVPPVQPQTPTVLPVMESQESEFVPHVVVKFHDGRQPKYSDDQEYRGNRMRRLFSSITAETEGYNREKTYFMVDLHDDGSQKNYPELIGNLMSFGEEVEIAYLDVFGEGPTVNPDDDRRFTNQDHLNPDPAKGGMDIKKFWDNPGADGRGMKFIDVEQGWHIEFVNRAHPEQGGRFSHEDLADQRLNWVGVGKNNENERTKIHGTMSLGVVCGTDNNKGVVGITPHLDYIGVSSYVQSVDEVVSPSKLTHNIADAILAARKELSCGDVILLEIHATPSNRPIEVLALPSGEHEHNPHLVAIHATMVEHPSLFAVFDQIQQATNEGIIVIEAAGNGGLDLDTDANTPTLRAGMPVSGAIMVGAVKSDNQSPWEVTDGDSTNHGTRVDCCAWGERVLTTRIPTNDYFQFAGTSSASAIIAGIALGIQGIRRNRGWNLLNAAEMRALMSNQGSGTDLRGPGIGILPDLKKLVDNMPQVGGCH